ncbi:glycoside hydrolase family 88 protein [Marinifilum sp. D737]|uniref:glycoside hydrolase family 88 protein n=1 Tax=Marinifilum sp. D737 TaxID=2969628 RepID=UPI002272B16E|nr:glycoside hydrolase family 88 protein [Marinifilum sp. D737]MCY1634307.1 glycoside hydrolase family 88 protein [Marinifilum sp. D737]
MKQNLQFTILLTCVAFLWSCNSPKHSSNNIVEENVEFATQQIGREIESMNAKGEILNPRTIHKDGTTRYNTPELWTSGFFPGSLWYLYELTGDSKWKIEAEKVTETLDTVQYLTWHHDVGFMVYCSYGNGYRLTKKPEYKDVIIQAAKSLSTRYRPNVGAIQSWNVHRGWQAKRGWQCPVIIDNMMNLELLFEATKLSGDNSFRDIAIKHAETTMDHHFREDYSSYHVIDYDTITGQVRNKVTAQGYADHSAWSRGQAWAIYGYTLCYRETKDPKFLKQAEAIANYLFTHPRMPKDLVPYWDFDCKNIPNTPRDASAASVIASALYELSTYNPEKSAKYKKLADEIVVNLSSPAYRAKLGENNNFLLMHSVGSIPHGAEIDVPLNYADYYFLEALCRKRELEKPAAK